MLILHSADWHIGELVGPVIDGKNARLQDTLRCIDSMIEHAECREVPDVILIAGDMFDKSKLWGDNMLSLIDEAAMRLRKLAYIAPTILLFGTDNHDSMRAFENISDKRIPDLHIITQPDLFVINTESGRLQVAGLPGFDKGYFRANHPGMAPAEESMMCSKFLGDMVNGLSAQLDPTIPSVLMAHYTVVGCELDNGQHVFTQSEVVLPKEALAGSAFDMVALGHIHRAQRVEGIEKPVFYSGPVNGITFNEEGQDKGFWMHEIGTIEGDEYSEMPNYVGSEFVKTPSRDFLTMKVDFTYAEDLQAFMKWNLAGIFGDTIREGLLSFPTVGKIVRLEYECTDEQKPLLNHKEMESLIKAGGAFHVAEVKAKRVVSTMDKQELTETSGPLENLYAWLVAEGFVNDEIIQILELARPMIATISAKMPTGTLSGVFEPRSLEVRNYRSYQQETFNFQDIFFATVNGPNGIGKSAFFMDSISDCLYEETRTGVTGSWITNGQTDGMLSFEFSMGSTNWRVIRNRSIKGSGKITLALQEQIGDKWEDRSGTTAKQTQEKIESLLGMDCATFRCTALIMQDAYGLFMEADKEQRMGVLANILGLSIYEQLTDLAKAKVTELNKSLTVSKAKLADLEEKLKVRHGLEIDLAATELGLKQVTESITTTENEIKAAEELVRTRKTKAEKVESLKVQISDLNQEVAAKKAEIEVKRNLTQRAQQMLANEAAVLAKADEYEQVKNQTMLLETKKPKALELMNDHSRITNEIGALDNQINNLIYQTNQIENVLASKPELDIAADQYRSELEKLEAMDELSKKASAKNDEILIAEKDTDRTADEIYEKGQKIKEIRTTLEYLTGKSLLLANANCIDPENAKCAFLADAQKAKTQIPIFEQQIRDIEQEIANMQEARKPFCELVEKLNKEYEAIGYSNVMDRQRHYDLKKLVADLRPKVELAGQLDSKVELLKGLQAQLTDYKKRRNDLQMQLDDVIGSSVTLHNELAVLPELNERLPKLLQWVRAKEELPAARQLIASTTEIITGIEVDINVKVAQVKELEDKQVQLSLEVNGLLPVEFGLTSLRLDIESLQKQQNNFHAKIGALKSQLEALAKDDDERRQLANNMEPTVKSLVNYQTLTKAFGLDGIPFSIVRSVVPELSATSNEILGQMTGGKMALEMRTERIQRNKKEVNALEVWITDWRGNIPYKDRSGGQKVKAALANAFALADLKARRVGIQLGMMFVDEPSFLDAEGAEAYCDALEMLSVKYPNMKVIAISHDPMMKSRFPQIIEVTDSGDGGSKVRIA